MKPKSRFLAILAVNAALNALGQAPAIPTDGRVAFYPLDGNADDAGTNQFHGVPTALAYQTNRFGFSGAAGSFDGENSRVRVPTTANFNLLPVTATAWVRLDKNAGTDLSIVSTYFTASANGWGIFVNGDFARSWYYGTQGSVPTDTLTTAALSAPKWYHLATSFDTTGGKLYVDGQLIASGAWDGFPGVSTSQQGLILGEMLAADGSHQNYRGLIDDVRIYNRALSGVEVSSLYQIEANPFRRAQATAEVINGFVVGVNIADGGQGYSEPPSVEIIGSGNGAKAVATVEFGRVVGVQVTNAGTGYAGSVSVRIAPPPKAPTLRKR